MSSQYTALHRVLAAAPGPITDDMITRAVDLNITETEDLDWKSGNAPTSDLAKQDIVKDIAAMANRGGGVIVFGVREDGSTTAAVERDDAGQYTDSHKRALTGIAASALHPPVLGVEAVSVGSGTTRAVVVVVPPSSMVPHVCYRGEYFGAPLRNGTGTIWMAERGLEALYRVRFDAQRRLRRRLDDLYDDTTRRFGHTDLARVVGVAIPVHPRPSPRLDREHALHIRQRATSDTFSMTSDSYPMVFAGHYCDRGLRSWVFGPETDSPPWRQATVSIHDDGVVTLAATVGGQKLNQHEHLGPGDVRSRFVEALIAALFAHIHRAGLRLGYDDYDVKFGIVHDGDAVDLMHGSPEGEHLLVSRAGPVPHMTPVDTTVRVVASPKDLLGQVRELALDVLNQAGIDQLQCLLQEPRETAYHS